METETEGRQSQSERFESARALRDSLRFNELRQKRGIDRTDEENREYARLYSRNRRKAIREEGSAKGQQALKISKQVLAQVKTAAEFHALNRKMVSGQQIAEWKRQSELVQDQLYWMRTWHEQDPNDELFVGFDEGYQNLLEFVREQGGFVKDAYKYGSSYLNDFRPFWAIWLPESRTEKPWGTIAPYFKDSERLLALCDENEPTRVAALYGFSISIPEYHFLAWQRGLKQ